MARGRRTAVAAAKEPVDGPWELPDGWRWERLGTVAEINPKTDFTSLAPDQQLTFLPMAAVAEESGRVNTLATRSVAEVTKGFTRFQSGDVLFAKITPCMENGKVATVPRLEGGVGAGSTEFHVIRSQELEPNFVYYFLVQRAFRQEAQRNMSGSAGQLRVPTDYLREVPIPVPNATEQRRIVTRIDTLFAEIEEGEQALAKARTGVETYRKALLKAAVTGELTADWRARNPPKETGQDLLRRILADRRKRWDANPKTKGKRSAEPAAPDTDELPDLPEGWCWTTLGQLFSIAVGATPSRSDASLWRGPIPWVSSGEVAFCRIATTRESIAQHAVGSDRVHPPGTVLLGMIGEGRTRGQAAILDIAAAHNQNCASIRVGETVIPPEYLYWWLEHQYEQTRSEGAGGNQPALNKERVSAILLPLAPAAELVEIARILNSHLDQHGDIADALLEAVASPPVLRQSILAAAFRGELVT